MSYQASNYIATLEAAPDGTRISPTQKGLLLLLAHHFNDDRRAAWPSMGLLAKEAGLDERSVRRHLHHLEHVGVLRIDAVQPEAGGGRQRPNHYSFPLMTTRAARIPAGGPPPHRVEDPRQVPLPEPPASWVTAPPRPSQDHATVPTWDTWGALLSPINGGHQRPPYDEMGDSPTPPRGTVAPPDGGHPGHRLLLEEQLLEPLFEPGTRGGGAAAPSLAPVKVASDDLVGPIDEAFIEEQIRAFGALLGGADEVREAIDRATNSKRIDREKSARGYVIHWLKGNVKRLREQQEVHHGTGRGAAPSRGFAGGADTPAIEAIRAHHRDPEVRAAARAAANAWLAEHNAAIAAAAGGGLAKVAV